MPLTKKEAEKIIDRDQKVKDLCFIAATYIDNVLKEMQKAQITEYCRENEIAQEKLREAQMWINRRFHRELNLCIEK